MFVFRTSTIVMPHKYFVELGKKKWKEHMNLGPARANEKNSDEAKQSRQIKYMSRSGYRHEKKKTWKVVGRNIVQNKYYEIAIVLLTFMALFMEDVEILLLTSGLWDSPNTGIAQYIKDVVCCSCWVFTFVAVHRLIYIVLTCVHFSTGHSYARPS